VYIHRLGTEDKLAYVEEQRQVELDRLFVLETNQIARESALDVHVLTYYDLIHLMSDVRSSFELGLQAMWIPELQLFPAQKLLRAQFLMRNRVVAEENRSMLSIKEALIEKSRLEIQVQCNRDLSRSTQKIDFDYLVCRNHDHWNEIDMLTDHITRLKTLHSKFVLFLVKIPETALMVCFLYSWTKGAAPDRVAGAWGLRSH